MVDRISGHRVERDRYSEVERPVAKCEEGMHRIVRGKPSRAHPRQFGRLEVVSAQPLRLVFSGLA